jgi:hypothetical protein
MTIQVHTGELARHPGNRSASVVEILPRSRMHDPAAKPGVAAQRLATISRAAAGVLVACWSRLLAGLHESRRRQAAIERARYRHLIYDSETGISFPIKATEQTATLPKTVLPLVKKSARRYAIAK